MKRIMTAFLVCVLVLSLTACGSGKSKAAEVDMDALAADLLSSGGFTDSLNQPADGVAERLYDLGEGDASQVLLYTGTGSTAEELFLAKAGGADAAALRAACEKRVENQIKVFQNYAPEEVAKLEAAVLTVAGDTVILAVSADAAAAQAVVDRYLGA